MDDAKQPVRERVWRSLREHKAARFPGIRSHLDPEKVAQIPALAGRF